MPITQARFIEVIDAGMELWRELESIAKAIRDGKDSPVGMELLAMEFDNPSGKFKLAKSLITLEREHKWFKRFGKENERQARAQARRRGKDGIPTRVAKSPVGPKKGASNVISAPYLDEDEDALEDARIAAQRESFKSLSSPLSNSNTQPVDLNALCKLCQHSLDLHEGGPCMKCDCDAFAPAL